MDDAKNCDLLFEYLKSILYDGDVKTLDIDSLDKSFQKLGKGLQYLEKAVTEMKDYSAALSKGNLSVEPPPRDNFLCENLKNIHASLNHLTWQAKQVAKGDYSQTVSFLGEFSKAFNSMTMQLQERETQLIKEAETEKENAGKDALTEIGNRYYFHEKATQLLNNKKRLVFCYCDLDHLKYINDKYGHTEGDYYIQDFVSTVKQFINTDDIFARLGGDEFCIIFSECTYRQAKSEIDEIQHIFAHDKSKIYHKNFSCGILEIPADHEEVSISDIISHVDKIMYQQKKEHYSSKTDFV